MRQGLSARRLVGGDDPKAHDLLRSLRHEGLLPLGLRPDQFDNALAGQLVARLEDDLPQRTAREHMEQDLVFGKAGTDVQISRSVQSKTGPILCQQGRFVHVELDRAEIGRPQLGLILAPGPGGPHAFRIGPAPGRAKRFGTALGAADRIRREDVPLGPSPVWSNY